MSMQFRGDATADPIIRIPWLEAALTPEKLVERANARSRYGIDAGAAAVLSA
jgi:hypothetical protein